VTTAHDLLGLPEDANPAEIRRAYRMLAKTHHPSAGGNAARFQQIKAAHDALLSGEAYIAPALSLPAPAPAFIVVASHWLAAALCMASGVYCFLRGDTAIYNGFLVAAGWGFLILGWRIFAERKKAWRNPAKSLRDGVTTLTQGALIGIWRLALWVLAILMIVGVVGVIEFVAKHR
jgi:hypothetical protein